jgi:plasmid stability protein
MSRRCLPVRSFTTLTLCASKTQALELEEMWLLATLTIRNVDDEVVTALKARAKRNSRSLEAEIRVLLRDLVQRGAEASLRELADRIAAMTPKVPQTDSTELIREDRAR